MNDLLRSGEGGWRGIYRKEGKMWGSGSGEFIHDFMSGKPNYLNHGFFAPAPQPQNNTTLLSLSYFAF